MVIQIKDTGLGRTDLSVEFAAGTPFPNLVIDNFLPDSLANDLLAEINQYNDFQKSNDYIFAKNKFESPSLEKIGPNCAAIKEFLLSRDVSKALSTVYGKELFVDPYFTGGGLHRGGEGSYLDMHTDFSIHPLNHNWMRELNLILYLNKDWKQKYGGNLELRNSLTNHPNSIEPLFNRMIIMLTKDFTLHGYKPIQFPEGVYRTSIAAYAYSESIDGEIQNLRSTTTWAPEGGSLVKTLLARYTPHLVNLKQRIFGSSTARKK
jgi:Rps23 Pro-64 3,4-dihydroxylase Tpa1-like proline 4-hydroxylase